MIYFSCPDLGNLGSEPLLNTEEEWFTDISDFMRERKRPERHTVSSQTQAIEAGSLTPETSAQKPS